MIEEAIETCFTNSNQSFFFYKILIAITTAEKPVKLTEKYSQHSKNSSLPNIEIPANVVVPYFYLS